MSSPNAKDPLTGQFTSELLRGKPNPHKVSGPGFQPGNPGRPLGSRHKISESFLKALHADFETGGVAAIARVRDEDPSTYIRVVASMLPKEVEIKRPLAEMSDDELANAVDLIRAAMAGSIASDGGGAPPEASGKKAVLLLPLQ